MKKEDLVFRFVIGTHKATGSNLYIEGNCLINYKTVIAYRCGEKILLNNDKYSQTTTRNQNLVRKYCKNCEIECIEMSHNELLSNY